MPARLSNLVDERIQDTLKVWFPTSGVLALVNLVDLKLVAELLLLAVTTLYTLWRWRRDARSHATLVGK